MIGQFKHVKEPGARYERVVYVDPEVDHIFDKLRDVQDQLEQKNSELNLLLAQLNADVLKAKEKLQAIVDWDSREYEEAEDEVEECLKRVDRIEDLQMKLEEIEDALSANLD